MCVNLDVQSHPVGCSPPQILVFSFHSESNFTLAFSIVLEKGTNKNTANIFDKENDIFLALDLKILWCKRSHRVRFYIHIHVNVYVSNLRKLPCAAQWTLRYQGDAARMDSGAQGRRRISWGKRPKKLGVSHRRRSVKILTRGQEWTEVLLFFDAHNWASC